ncbi:MAG: ribonuclease Z, partial [Methylothermaceae bacterium]|nr:ribonuclease Z [Methylothermaceae bacterium]
ASFARDAADSAAEKYHLTAVQAGQIARRVGAKRMVPFHFSARYAGKENQLYREAEAAFSGMPCP